MQKQSTIQIQEQQQLLQQHLSPLQLQVVRMLEMPLAQLEENVKAELDSNPSLEGDSNGSDDYADTVSDDYVSNEDLPTDSYTSGEPSAERDEAIADALDMMYRDDVMEGGKERTTIENGTMTSFIDILTEQMNMEELTDTEHQIMEYLIGSLDDDGLLRKDLDIISDELAIYHYLYVEREQIEAVLDRIKEFDPAGVGAQSLKECLLIQVGRMRATPQKMLLYSIIDEDYDDFTHNRWSNICRRRKISDSMAEELRHEIRHHLNPKPGASFGETQGRSLQQITPDVIVHVDLDGTISFELNNGSVPQLHVVREDQEMLETAISNRQKSGWDEAYSFVKHNVDRALIYIQALRQRNETITATMHAIIQMQRQYFLSGDDSDLKPMVLKDVAERTGYDVSTISRVTRSKYMQTPWGTYQLRHVFSEGYTTNEGELLSTRTIKEALRDVIAKEDKRHPMSDDKLVSVMKERGYPIARRTIAKYREQLGIPVARMRKK